MIAQASGAAQHVSEDLILQIGSGFRAAKLLLVANEIGLFEYIADGVITLTALAERTSIPEARLRVVVNAMVALDLLEHDGATTYRNAPVAAGFLTSHSGTDLRPALRF